MPDGFYQTPHNCKISFASLSPKTVFFNGSVKMRFQIWVETERTLSIHPPGGWRIPAFVEVDSPFGFTSIGLIDWTGLHPSRLRNHHRPAFLDPQESRQPNLSLKVTL